MKTDKKIKEILLLSSTLSVEAVSEILGVDKYKVMHICVKNGQNYKQANADRARYEVLSYRLQTEGYDEQLVRERNLLSLKIYREVYGRKRIKFNGLAEKNIDEYLIG